MAMEHKKQNKKNKENVDDAVCRKTHPFYVFSYYFFIIIFYTVGKHTLSTFFHITFLLLFFTQLGSKSCRELPDQS